ncbi:hypothetical protein MMC15_006605 [Xylographa vitiligo]|nr:hypothetical protein [Xylographa vitiligo]
MPGREVYESMDFSNFAKSASFKSHKAFPRRRVDLNHESAFWGNHDAQDRSSSAIEIKDESRLWDSLLPTAQADTLFHQPLPLTPPPVPREDTTRKVLMRADSNTLPSPLPLTSPGLSTPVGQRSPPTPENTPPAKKGHQDSLSPPQLLRQGSSRAESFKTAREDFSDDDNEILSRTSPNKPIPLRQHWTEELKLDVARDAGLGLGLKLDDEDKTPTAQAPRVRPESWTFNTFDGAWSHSTETVKEDPMVASSPVPMSPIGIGQHFDQDTQTPLVLPSDPASPLSEADLPIGRNLSLRERIEKKRSSPVSLSTEHFAEQIQWPVNIEQADIDAKVRQVDSKRLSQMSATSTIVEAMVIETPPQRRRTLRHTGKNGSLRTASSPISGSNRSSFISDGTRHRLVHRNTKIAEHGNRNSLNLENLSSTDSDSTMARKRPVPAPVIPQRRSSLKSSATNSKRHSMAHSTSNAPKQSSRPTTAPTAATGYFDIPRRHIRTMSDSLESPILSRLQDMLPKNPPLVIPVRSSSLSAPTSREASRTTSITSTSHRRQEVEQIMPTTVPLPLVDVVTRPSTPSEQDNDVMTDIKDLSGLRPRSALVTPFSMVSMNSSTPGTLEVSEATAVNIYPHNNRSILLVQQLARWNSDGQEPSTIPPEIANFTLTRPPEEVSTEIPPQPTHSPLRHPRPPPQPPNFMVIPPTPADRTPTLETDRQLGHPHPDALSSSRFAKVRRALSARRYSESFTSPLRSFSQRHTTTASRRTTTTADPDSKLSPFWRPRAFWDDLSDSNSDSDPPSHNRPFATHPAASPPKRTVSGPSALSRRFASLTRPRHRPHHPPSPLPPPAESFQSVRRTFSDESIRSYAFIATGRKLGTVPRLGYQIHFVGWRGLQDLYERRKGKREEGRREKERVRLRGRIGPVVGGEGEWGV